MKNEVFLDFCIWGFEDITVDYITQTLGIQPTKVYIKGQKKNPKFTAVAKQNGWRMDSGLGKYASFEDQMKTILDIIESKIDLFRPFCEKYYCEFSCAIFIRYDNNESTPSVHLDARYNRLIKELNIEFDVDLYCLPNDHSE
jgi:hypothetical protein